MSSSRSLRLITLIIILVTILLAVSILPGQAAVMRRVSWWGGGANIAYHIDYACTNTVSFNFVVNIEEPQNLDAVDVKIKRERGEEEQLNYTLPIHENQQALEVWVDAVNDYEIQHFTHEAFENFDLRPLNAQLGDRIIIEIHTSNKLYATLDCVNRGADGNSNYFGHSLNWQGDDETPASPVFPHVDPQCTAGTTRQQYQQTVTEEDMTIGTVDVAMHFDPHEDLDNLRAELSHTYNGNTTTITLWEEFGPSTTEPDTKLGSRCQAVRQDPMADFLLTDNSDFSLPIDQGPPALDRAYQPTSALSAFSDESILGTWTLNICELTAESPIVPNGDFESGSSNWSEYSSNAYPLIYHESNLYILPHGGSWAAWLGGASNEVSRLSQSVTVPTQTPILSYWYDISSVDSCGYDFARIYANDNLESQIDMCQTTGGWVQRTLDLSSYAGSQVNLVFEVETDVSLSSSQLLDDITWQSDLAPIITSALTNELPTDAVLSPQKDEIESTAVDQYDPQFPDSNDDEDVLQCWFLNFSEDVAQPEVQFDHLTYTVQEDDTAIITVKLTEAYNLPLEIDYATSDGTAVANVDYIPTAGTLTFAPGETEHSFTVTTLPDQIPESAEDLNIMLSNPVNVNMGTISSAILTIHDANNINNLYLPVTLYAPQVYPGFWSGIGTEFYVSPDSQRVHNFAIFISVNGCGDYKIIHTIPENIVQRQFSFSGPFYASGTFNTLNTVSGTLGLNHFFISGCGHVSGGPFTWDADWQNDLQPTITIDSTDTQFKVEPTASSGNHFLVPKSIR